MRSVGGLSHCVRHGTDLPYLVPQHLRYQTPKAWVLIRRCGKSYRLYTFDSGRQLGGYTEATLRPRPLEAGTNRHSTCTRRGKTSRATLRPLPQIKWPQISTMCGCQSRGSAPLGRYLSAYHPSRTRAESWRCWFKPPSMYKKARAHTRLPIRGHLTFASGHAQPVALSPILGVLVSKRRPPSPWQP